MEFPDDRISIGCLPRVFVDKRGQQHRLEQLKEQMHASLVEMYLAFKPRNSFQGLPPLRDEVCVKWVHDILRTAVHVVSIGPCVRESPQGNENGCNAVGTGIVGHVALFPIDHHRCELLVVVCPEFQNLGLGTELTRTCIDAATQLGFRRIWLPVDATNVRARRVYEKCGFEYISRGPSRELDMAHDLNPPPPNRHDAPRDREDAEAETLADAVFATGLPCGAESVPVAS